MDDHAVARDGGLGGDRAAEPAEPHNAAGADVERVEDPRLEHAVHVVSEQAVKAHELVDEAKAAGGGDHAVTVHAKMLRLELLKVKADLERERETWVPNCKKCGLDVH